MNTKINRCDWAEKHPLELEYHDNEWGVPIFDDRHLFEMLILEGAQAGLSWLTVLKKRENYRVAFDHFNPEIIAGYDDEKIAELLENPGIIRNRLKVRGTVKNAKAFLEVVNQEGSFSNYIWQFTNGRQIVNRFETMAQVPSKTDISNRMSRQLKKDGFTFVGSTICYAFMQATGMVNDHLTACFRYSECLMH